MVTLISWATSPTTANAYSDVATAQTYFDARLGAAAWTAATADEKAQALISATRMIDRQVWQGTQTTSTDPLAWPRTGVVDRYGDAVDSATLPGDLILGTYELALALLEDEGTQDLSEAGGNVKRVKAGPVEVELFRPTLGLEGRFPTIVNELLGQFMAGPFVEAAYSTGQQDSQGCDRVSYFDENRNSYLYDDWIP